jgi:hypothetical protein
MKTSYTKDEFDEIVKQFDATVVVDDGRPIKERFAEFGKTLEVYTPDTRQRIFADILMLELTAVGG